MILFFILSVLVMTAAGSVGAILFKRAMSDLQGSLLGLLKKPLFYLGGVCYAVGLILNVILMRFFEYTLVYPSSALTYAWTLLISVLFLKERFNLKKLFAVLFIVLGIVIMNL